MKRRWLGHRRAAPGTIAKRGSLAQQNTARGLVALLLIALAVAESQAQTLLRWKLKTGDSLAVESRQQTDSQVSFTGKSATTKINVRLYSTWSVVAADEDRFTINQSIDRIIVDLVAPDSPPLQYDTGANVRPTGPAANLASALKPLVGAAVEMVMNGRGEIQSVKAANKAAEWMFGSSSSKSDSADSSHVGRRNVSQILRKPLIVFPEAAVGEGESWEHREHVSIYPWTFEQTSTYRLAGTIDREGKRLVKIEMSAKLNPETEPGLPAGGQGAGETRTIKAKSHEQTGTILFSPQEGRVVESEQAQKLVTERTYRETAITVALESTQMTTISSKQ